MVLSFKHHYLQHLDSFVGGGFGLSGVEVVIAKVTLRLVLFSFSNLRLALFFSFTFSHTFGGERGFAHCVQVRTRQQRTITTTFKHLHRLGVGKLTFEVNLSFRQLFFESFNRLHRLEHIKSHQGIKVARDTFETFKLVLLVDCTLSLSAITSCSSSISSCSSHSSLLRLSARARQSYTKHTKQMAP